MIWDWPHNQHGGSTRPTPPRLFTSFGLRGYRIHMYKLIGIMNIYTHKNTPVRCMSLIPTWMSVRLKLASSIQVIQGTKEAHFKDALVKKEKERKRPGNSLFENINFHMDRYWVPLENSRQISSFIYLFLFIGTKDDKTCKHGHISFLKCLWNLLTKSRFKMNFVIRIFYESGSCPQVTKCLLMWFRLELLLL